MERTFWRLAATMAAESWGGAMNDNENAAYYFSRAEQEEEAARKATNPIAAEIHRSLANRYRAKAYDLHEWQRVSTARD